jgi:hypothetical protein
MDGREYIVNLDTAGKITEAVLRALFEVDDGVSNGLNM